jgi:hypothetical protein
MTFPRREVRHRISLSIGVYFPGSLPEAARERVEEAIREGRLVPAELRYTTQTALEREKRILQIEREGRDQVSPIAPAEAVHRRLDSSHLSSGQCAAVELIASTSHRTALRGAPGLIAPREPTLRR